MLAHSKIPSAFTLVETIVSIAIISLLVVLILPAVQKVRSSTYRMDCQNRMRQLALASHSFHATHGNHPMGFRSTKPNDKISPIGYSVLNDLLPYLEQQTVFERIQSAHRSDPTIHSDEHGGIGNITIKAFRCPSDPRVEGRFSFDSPELPTFKTWAITNYLGVAGSSEQLQNGVFHTNLKIATTAIKDGTSNTLMFGERTTPPHGYGSPWYAGWATMLTMHPQILPVSADYAKAVNSSKPIACGPVTQFEYAPYDNPCHFGHYSSLHSGGANFAFADGSVKFLPYSAVNILPALATRSGGESIHTD